MRTTTRCVVGLFVALSLAGSASAQDCGWEWVNPIPPRVDIFRLKLEVSTFVGVGAAGTIIRSRDGLRWELVESGVDEDLLGVDWGAGFFVAVGRGVILRGIAGYDWVEVYQDPDAVLVDVEYSASRFVAVGDGLDGHLLTSSLGLEWELVPVPWSGPADSIAGSNDGFYVAVGREIWFSSNGFDWEFEGSAPASMAFKREPATGKKIGSDLFELDRIDLGWTGSRLLWAGGSELWARVSIEEWELISILNGCEPYNDWLGIASGPGWAMASGIFDCPAATYDPTVSLIISTDGGVSFHEPWETELGGFPGLARYGSRWVAAGSLGDVMTSSNGSNWDCQGGGCTSLACADEFADLAWNEGTWLAVGGVGLCDTGLKRNSGATTARSGDGSQWQVSAPAMGRFRGLAGTETGFIGVGDGWIAKSGNGVDWTSASSPDNAVLYSVATNDEWAVAVGQYGALYISDDGENWLKPFLYVTADLDRVAWVGDEFLVLGHDGTILRSMDANNWSEALAASDADLKGAAGGPERKIIVGAGGVILSSSDGDLWTPRRSGVDATLSDVTWGDDRFVAVGWDDQPNGARPAVVLASATGDRWTRFAPPGEGLERVRWTGTSWLMVGGDRTILRADCLGTLIEFGDEHLQIPLGETVDLEIRLSDEVVVDTEVSVVSSSPTEVVVPQTVTILAGSDSAVVPVTGASVVAGAVVSVTLPAQLGGGSTNALATVQPPQWTPRTPSGSVRP